MDKLMEFLHKALRPMTKLGGGRQWQVGKVTVYLWPFVALAIFVLLLVMYDYFLA